MCIAIEVFEPSGFRCRMQTLTDASATSLRAFITSNVEPGAHLITDVWNGYNDPDCGSSHLGNPGRTTTSRRSTAGCAMNA